MALCTSAEHLSGRGLTAAEKNGLFSVAKAGKVRLARLGTLQLKPLMSKNYGK